MTLPSSNTGTQPSMEKGPLLRLTHCHLGKAPKGYSTNCLRKIVASKIGRSNDWIHNHRLDDGQVIYRQPRIHYHLDDQGRFSLTGLQEGAALLRDWFANGCPVRYHNNELYWRSTESRLQERLFSLGIDPDWHPIPYRLERYFALNNRNYQRFVRLQNPQAALAFMSNVLSQHLYTFARAYGWTLPESASICQVVAFQMRPSERYERTRIYTFDLQFYSPLELPEKLFLGKRSSLGYGRLFRIEND